MLYLYTHVGKCRYFIIICICHYDVIYVCRFIYRIKHTLHICIFVYCIIYVVVFVHMYLDHQMFKALASSNSSPCLENSRQRHAHISNFKALSAQHPCQPSCHTTTPVLPKSGKFSKQLRPRLSNK